jgi:heat shock protein HslJ
VLAWQAGLALAVAPGWVCFGTEPSWGLRFTDATHATLSVPDAQPVEHEGNAQRLPAMPEWMWRGRSSSGPGDIVAFIAERACNDGMSDTTHRASVRLSLPDGRFLAGCCRVVAGSDGIEGRRWQLAAIEGIEADLAAARAPITVRFDGGRIEGFGGCNVFTGGYSHDAGSLTIGPLAGTMMACAPGPMALETAVLRALAGTFHVEVSGRGMTLASQPGPVLIFEEASVPKLDRGKWKVSGFNNGRQAVVSPLDGTALWLQFRAGTVQGHAGCNSFRGPYTADGSQVAIGPLAATRKVCGRRDVMQQEREFLAALRSVTTWSIDARSMLDMHRADGQRALTAIGASQ